VPPPAALWSRVAPQVLRGIPSAVLQSRSSHRQHIYVASPVYFYVHIAAAHAKVRRVEAGRLSPRFRLGAV
jgi:hypothetical protein